MKVQSVMVKHTNIYKMLLGMNKPDPKVFSENRQTWLMFKAFFLKYTSTYMVKTDTIKWIYLV
jgi:hypothetical protein